MRLAFYNSITLFVLLLSTELAAIQLDIEADNHLHNVNKAARFSRMAYRSMKPAMHRLEKFAGSHAEELLGMTPVG